MVSVDEIRHRLAEAERIVRKAGRLARHHFANVAELRVERKGIQDYVSAADREVETVIHDELARAFPGEAFLGEEGGGEVADSIWVSDPIDGTTNFLREIPLYGISLAFVRDRETEVGVIYLPQLDEMYAASRSGPATLDTKPIQVRPSTALHEALVVIGYDPSRPYEQFFGYLGRLLESKCEFRRFGSATLALCMVASGRVDAFWQQHLKPWDALAGLLIVERAGGRVSDFLANDGLGRGSPVLASSPEIAPELSERLEIALKPRPTRDETCA